MKNNKFLRRTGWGSMFVGVVTVVCIKIYGGSIWIADVGNIFIAVGFALALWGETLKSPYTALPDAMFFKNSQGNFQELKSAKDVFQDLLYFAFVSWSTFQVARDTGRESWIFYLFVPLGVLITILAAVWLWESYVKWTQYLRSPNKDVVYRWNTTSADGAVCHICGTVVNSATYGMFTVTKKNSQSLWRWWFKPIWRYESWMSICSSTCFTKELDTYAFSMRNV